MTKWIYTVCLIVIVTLMAGAGAALAIDESSDEMSDDDLGAVAGIIDSIGKNAVVIDDMKYNFASDATFLSRTGDRIIKSMFKIGDPVDFVLNANNEISTLQRR